MKKICIAIIAILITLESYTIVQALSKTELEQKRIELKNKIEQAGENLENINIELTETLDSINSLDKEIYLYEEQIDKISQNLIAIEKQIDETEVILKEVEKKYEYQKRTIRKKISICI